MASKNNMGPMRGLKVALSNLVVGIMLVILGPTVYGYPYGPGSMGAMVASGGGLSVVAAIFLGIGIKYRKENTIRFSLLLTFIAGFIIMASGIMWFSQVPTPAQGVVSILVSLWLISSVAIILTIGKALMPRPALSGGKGVITTVPKPAPKPSVA